MQKNTLPRIVVTKKNKKSDVILKHAAALFRIKGYPAASMRELAAEMKIEAPSLYNHFSSKANILENICENVAERFTTHLKETEEKTLCLCVSLKEIKLFRNP